MIGQTFNRLTVLAAAGKNKHRQPLVRCLCSCGVEKVFVAARVKSGETKSCGCYFLEVAAERGRRLFTTHGLSNTRGYRAWADMLKRCRDTKRHDWLNYGGRGITVCERWNDFKLFFADMGPAPAGASIDRIDNDKGYAPENCRWATPKEQANNRRSNIRISYEGATRTLTEWAEKFGVPSHMVLKRYYRGWQPPQLFMPPTRDGKRETIFVTYDGKTQSLSAWARSLGMPSTTVFHRYKRGIRPPELFQQDKKEP